MPEKSSAVILREINCFVPDVHTGYPGMRLVALRLDALTLNVPFDKSAGVKPDPPPLRKGLLICYAEPLICVMQKEI